MTHPSTLSTHRGTGSHRSLFQLLLVAVALLSSLVPSERAS